MAFFAGLLVLSVCGLRGQSPSSGNATGENEPGPQTARTGSAVHDGFFRIDVAVADEAGNPITDLAPGEFTLLDNGNPTRIFSLNGSAAPAEPQPVLIFVVDAVNLSPQQVRATESAITHFLRRNDGRLDQPCVLYRFTSDGLYSSLGPSRDGDHLAGQVEENKFPWTLWRGDPRESNSLGSWDAGMPRNRRSLHALGSIAIDQREVAGRKVLVWIGPGWPVAAGDNSFDQLTELSTRLREARITVDSVTAWPNPDPTFRYQDHLEAPQSQKDMQPGKMALQVIATQTGGLVLGAPGDQDPARLDGDIERCAADARSYYTLTFSPPRTDRVDDYHQIAVVVARPGMTARTATGYYNEPVYFDSPRPGVEKVTVAELEQIVHSAPGLGRRLPNLELTQRLSTPRLNALLPLVHGERERQALVSLADLSLALPPPADEIADQPTPAMDEQHAILQRTLSYLVNAIPRLPDFFASRNTVRYDEPPERNDESWKLPHADRTLHFAISEHATVFYRNGNESVEKKQKLGKMAIAGGHARNLETWGTFGSILQSVFVAATRPESTVAWKRWERGMDGNLAVFSFIVPDLATPLFEVTFCCLPQGDGTASYHNLTGYLGEFAVNPDTGAIMRIAITADLDEDRDPTVPIIRSQVMVEYGQQQLGGKVYICPSRSVSISRGRSLRQLHEWSMSFRLYSYFETMINDVTFGGYHKFGSESRILTGFEEMPREGSGSGKDKPRKMPR